MHRIRRLQESLRSNANSNSTDLASRTGDRRCVHRTPEGNLHQQLDESPPTQRKQQDQYQDTCTTGRHHIAHAVDGNTRRHIPTTDLGKPRLKIDGEYLSNLCFADHIFICAKTPHELQQMLQELAEDSYNQGLKMNKSKTKVMIHQYMSTTLRSRPLKDTCNWDRDTAPETKPRQGESKKTQIWMDGIRQAPLCLQG